MGVYRYCDNLCFEIAKYTMAWLMVKGKSVTGGYSPSTGLVNLWHACPKCQEAFAAVPCFLLLFHDQFLSIVKHMSKHSTYLTAYRMYRNYCCYQTIMSETSLNKSATVQVLTGYLSLGHQPSGDWQIHVIGQNIL